MKKIAIILTLNLCAVYAIGQTKENKCNKRSFEAVLPFLGKWKEYELKKGSEKFIGDLTTEIILDGCMLTQKFISEDKSVQYSSQGFVNTAGVIQENYLFSSGGYSKFLWVKDSNNLFTLKIEGSRKTDHIYRLKYMNVKEGSYEVVGQESHNGGKDWISKDTTRIKKVAL